MKLAHFPSEILGLILFGKHASHLALRLWTCGDSLLHAKLSSCVVYLNLKAGSKADYLHPLAHVNFSSLRHLYLKSRTCLFSHPEKCSTWLSSLPQGLETLDIFSVDAHHAVWTKIAKDSSPRSQPLLRDLKALFPHLRTLRIKNPSGDCPTRLQKVDLPLLPASLTQLSLGSSLMITLDDLDMLSLLPASMLRLECVIGITETLDHHNIAIALSYLPSEVYYITNITIIDNFELYNATMIGAFPHQVTDMEILNNGMTSSEGIYDPFKLPPSLTKLDIELPHAFTLAEFVSFLPRTLIEFSVLAQHTHLFQPQDEALLVWPPLLESLSIWNASMRQDQISQLPASLTKLVISHYLDMPIQSRNAKERKMSAKIFPPNLTHLSLALKALSSTFQLLTIDHEFPSNLHNLTITYSGPADINIQFMEKLPKHLSIFSLNSSSLHYSFDNWTFPTQLRSIEVRRWHSKWFKLLPASVRTFQCFQCIFTLHDGESTQNIDFFALLPAGILDLEIYQFAALLPNSPNMLLDSSLSPPTLMDDRYRVENRRFDFADHTFEPSSLLWRLQIYNGAVFPRKILQKLPKTLRKLHLTINVPILTPEIEAELPPSLHDFSLKSAPEMS